MRFCVLLIVAALAFAAGAVNTRPIIGILDQNLHGDESHTYIAASYVKWVESAGARVVPLLYRKWSVEKMEKVLKSINGVLLPGGSIKFEGKYLAQLVTIYNYVKKANDNGIHYPIWGTCLGVCAFVWS